MICFAAAYPLTNRLQNDHLASLNVMKSRISQKVIHWPVQIFHLNILSKVKGTNLVQRKIAVLS
jgi:hypothetical protein